MTIPICNLVYRTKRAFKLDPMIRILPICLCICTLCLSIPSFAGNPDRQGEAGAPELLMNPWARSAGLHTMNTSFISGVEALRLNVAGLAHVNKTEILLGHTRYLEGTDVKFNSFGLAQKLGENGVLGVSIMSVDFGDIAVTTTDDPEGTGATFSPNFFNLGIGYAHTFENKVSVGFAVRIISESIADLNAQGFALDAGVQYAAGDKDNFKFGISLRNIGSPMKFRGEGLSVQVQDPDPSPPDITETVDIRAARYELPSVLNVGASYDLYITPLHRLTFLGNFTSNSFSRDQVGGGVEYAFKDMFMVRGGYKYDIGSSGTNAVDAPIYNGVAAGASIEVPVKKGSANKFGIDYAYRHTIVWQGTHNISIRIKL